MKPNYKKTLKLTGVVIALATLSACIDRIDTYHRPYENPDDNGFTEVPLDFDWNMSQDVEIQLKSNVRTRAYIYEDENLKNLMCTTVLEADKPETVSLTTLNSLDKLYLAYLAKDGRTAVRTIDIAQQQILTRAINLFGDITDASETLPSSEGNKTLVFSPNRTVYGTVLFEDMYPKMGDYDMNDFVLGYRKQYGKTDTSETLEITLQIRAIGGTLPFVPGVEVKGVDVDGLDVSWTASDSRLSVENVSENDANGTPVFRVNGAQNIKPNGDYFNVSLPKVPQEELPYVTITLTRSLDGNQQLDIKDKDLNFFIYNTQSKVEIHEKNTKVTRFASNSDEKNFHDKGLVWAFRVEGYMPHTIEGKKIDQVFPRISNWMKSSGTKDADWLTDYDQNLVVDYSQDTDTGGSSDVQQEPYIDIKKNIVEAPVAGGMVEVPVEANCDFDVCFGEEGWIYDFTKEDGKLILYVYNNYNGTDKSATVTLIPTTDISKKFSFKVYQMTEAYDGALIQANDGFRNKIESLVKDNGGVITDVKKVNIIGHSDKYNGYKGNSLRNVKRIAGNDNNLPHNVYMEWDAANATITVSTPGAIVRTGNTCSKMFSNCGGLEEVNLSGLDISLCTKMEQMFISCKKLKSVDLTPLNTSNVTNMSGIFTLCESLESVNVKGLNTSNVTSMKNLFDRCYSLKSVDISSWNTDKVTTFNRMFWNCQKLTDVKMNCSKTSLTETGVTEMFTNCYLLPKVDMSSFDFHNANDFTSIFSDCKSLQTVVFGKSNTSNIINMKNAFAGVGGNGEFTCVDADFSSATIMDSAFKGCSATSINLSGWKTTSVQNLSSTFAKCGNAKKINISGWSADNVTSIGSMFNSAYIEEIDLGPNFNVPSSVDIDYWFYCTSNKSKKATLKCSRATYDLIQNYIKTTGGRNSESFLTQYCTYSVY